MEREQEEYQYFGKGGGGGVRKDYLGRVIVSRKSDPRLASNLYGKQSHNKCLRRTPGAVADYDGSAMTRAELEAISNYNLMRIRKEISTQNVLKQKLKAEQQKRRAIELKLMQRRVNAEKWRLEYVKGQENLKNEGNVDGLLKEYNRKRVSLQPKLANSKFVIQPELVLETPMTRSRQSCLSRGLTQDHTKYCLSQSNGEDEDVNLSRRIKDKLKQAIRKEITKLTATVKNEKTLIINSIQDLKVHLH